VTVQWNARTASGDRVPAGIYFVRLADRTGTVLVRRVSVLH